MELTMPQVGAGAGHQPAPGQQPGHFEPRVPLIHCITGGLTR